MKSMCRCESKWRMRIKIDECESWLCRCKSMFFRANDYCAVTEWRVNKMRMRIKIDGCESKLTDANHYCVGANQYFSEQMIIVLLQNGESTTCGCESFLCACESM